MGRLQTFVTEDGKHYSGVTLAEHLASQNNGKMSKGRPRDLQGETFKRVEDAYWNQVAKYNKLVADGASEKAIKENKPHGLWFNKNAVKLGLKPTEWNLDQGHSGDGGRKGRKYIAYFKQEKRKESAAASALVRIARPLGKQTFLKRNETEELKNNAETLRDEEVLEFLKAKFHQWKSKDTIYYGRTNRKLWFRFEWSDEGRLTLQFCKPDELLKVDLIKNKNGTGFYLSSDVPAEEAIRLIKMHAAMREAASKRS